MGAGQSNNSISWLLAFRCHVTKAKWHSHCCTLGESIPHPMGGNIMTIANATKFIKQGLHDSQLRDRMNTAAGIKERDAMLADERLQFTHDEFEDAYYNLLTLCTEAEAADQLKEFKNWWNYLNYLLEPGLNSNQCNGCGRGQSV
jgi:hypothetical protein